MSATPRRTKRLLGLVGAALLSLILVSPALAQTTTSVVVVGGSLTMTTPAAGNFAGVTIDGEAKQTTASLATFAVSDLRGTGTGWKVTAQASQFANADASRKLATGSLRMSAPTVSADGTLSPLPSVTSGPYTIDGGSAVKITSAALLAGMGKYNYGVTTLTLSLPADVFADTYTSTVTLTAAAGP